MPAPTEAVDWRSEPRIRLKSETPKEVVADTSTMPVAPPEATPH
jgi:hypothetical protein